MSNTVTVTGTNILAENAVASMTVAVELTRTTALTVQKTALPENGEPAEVGDTITYTYDITNTGSVTLYTVEMNDDKLGLTTVVTSAAPLGPQQHVQVIDTTTVQETDLPGPLSNTVTVTGTNILSERAVATTTAGVGLTFTSGISLQKTANVSTATLGDVIEYTYRLTNTGDVSITLTLVDNRLGTITSGLSIPAGQVSTVITNYTVVAGDIITYPQTPLSNTAVVTATDFEGNILIDTSTVTVTLVYTPQISLLKTANLSTAALNDVITYTYFITNTGNVTLTGITLVDDLLGPVAVSSPLSPDGGTTTGTATYTVQIADVNTGAITNTAIVSGDDILNRTIVGSQTLRVDVEATIGAITATNSSPNAVNASTLFTVTTDITNGVTYTWDFGDGDSGSGANTSHTYTAVGFYTATVTAANEVSVISTTTPVTITPGPLVGFEIIAPTTPQTAGVTFPITITAVDAYGNRIDTLNRTITLTDSTGTILPTSITLVDGITVVNVVVYSATSPAQDIIEAISGTITGTVGVEIQPNDPAVLLLDLSPDNIRVCQTSTATATVTDLWSNPVPGETVTIAEFPGSPAVEPVPPNSGTTNVSGIFTVTFRGIAAGGPANIVAQHASLGFSSGQNVTVVGPPVPNAITLTVTPDTVTTGGTATVSAEVGSCAGPVDGAVVTFTIPTAYGSVNPISSTTVGGIATTTVTAGTTPGNTTITGTVEGPLLDTVPFTITAATIPVLTLTKTANPGAGNVYPGGSIVYTVVVSNSGTGPANNVRITDTLDTDLDFVNQSITDGTGSYNSGTRTVSFTITSLANGAAVTATIETAVPTSAISGTTISNTATAGSDETGLFGPTAPISHQVITRTVGPIYLPIIMKNPRPDLIGSFSLSPPNPSAGQNVVVTVVVTNVGSMSTGSGFWVDFYVEPNPVPTRANQRWDALGSNVLPQQGIAWSVADPLAPGESIVLVSSGSGGRLPSADHIIWDGVFYSGTDDLYVYVDSFSSDGSSNGGILESDETNNRSQITGLGITGLNSSSIDRPAPLQLPPRWDP